MLNHASFFLDNVAGDGILDASGMRTEKEGSTLSQKKIGASSSTACKFPNAVCRYEIHSIPLILYASLLVIFITFS